MTDEAVMIAALVLLLTGCTPPDSAISQLQGIRSSPVASCESQLQRFFAGNSGSTEIVQGDPESGSIVGASFHTEDNHCEFVLLFQGSLASTQTALGGHSGITPYPSRLVPSRNPTPTSALLSPADAVTTRTLRICPWAGWCVGNRWRFSSARDFYNPPTGGIFKVLGKRLGVEPDDIAAIPRTVAIGMLVTDQAFSKEQCTQLVNDHATGFLHVDEVRRGGSPVGGTLSAIGKRTEQVQAVAVRDSIRLQPDDVVQDASEPAGIDLATRADDWCNSVCTKPDCRLGAVIWKYW